MKRLLLGLLVSAAALAGARAQIFPSAPFPAGSPGLIDSSSSDAPPSPPPRKTGTAQEPTTIDSQAMDYDEKTRVAIFSGDNYGVFLKDPQFTINCNKLTAYMRKSAPGTPLGQKPKPVPPPPAPGTPGARGEGPGAKGNGLQRAVAEGTADLPVVIVQDKPAANGEQPQHNVGIAEKADYNADTGDVILTGWPRVSQGINTQIATSASTVMIMNKDGHTMKTIGPSHTVIQEQQDQSKQPKRNSATPQ